MIPAAAPFFARLPRFFRRHKLIKAWMRLTGEDPLQLVRIRSEAFGYVDLNEGFMRLIVIDQDYEQEFFQIADAFLEQGGTFLDVGANFGLFSFGIARSLQGRVDFHLFEPNLKVVAAIRKTLARYPDMRCQINAMAVSDRIGTVSFKVNPDHTGISRVVETGGDTVPAVTLDAYCARANIDRIALLKLDVEGHELPVLLGARRQLQRAGIAAIYFEYSEQNLGVSAPGVIAYLDAMGYEVCFRRSFDLKPRGQPSHTVRAGLPGHGLELLPVRGWGLPAMTDLLAVPKQNLVPLG